MKGLSQTQPRGFEPLLFLSILISDSNQRHGLIAADKKRKHGATLFPAELFNYRRSENALISECRVTNNRSHVQAATPFCLVNRIFAQPCACVMIRGDPRAADARESMHIVDFQCDTAACSIRNMKFSWSSMCAFY